MRETLSQQNKRGLRRKVRGARSAGLSAREFREIVDAIRHSKVDAFVTKGKKTDQVLILQGAEHPYRVLVERVNDGTGMLDVAGTVLYANRRLAHILRVPHRKLVGSLLEEHVPRRQRQKLKMLLAKGVRKSSQGNIVLGAKGRRAPIISFVFSPVDRSQKQSISMVATEMTELVETKDTLVSTEESLRQLSGRLLRIQDEERRHIARDLHDVTGQKLALQTLTLSQVLSSSAALDPESRRALTECATLAKQVTDEIRTLSYMLHPPLLDEIGLEASVKWFAEGFQRRTGITVEVDVASGFRRLPEDVELALFRVVQESLSNVQRYSGAETAYVRLGLKGDNITLEVGDSGKGMQSSFVDVASGVVAPVGVGIQGMRERMRQLSGTLEIVSRPNRGTVVSAALPLPELRPAATAESSSERADRQCDVPGSAGEPAAFRKRILIADDHEMLRHGLRRVLQAQKDWEVCGEAADGKESVEKTIRLKPDVVILDINMPTLNGLDAARQILSARPQTKILAFTVHDSGQIMKEIKAAGIHAYLSKSEVGEKLLRVLKDLFSNAARIPCSAAAGA